MENNDAARKARAEYAREYRRRNPEKIKEINNRYWVKKAREMEEAKKNNE